MLYRDIESQEGYIHICDNAHKYRKEYIKNRPKIFTHDMRAYMRIGGGLLDVEYCPYCGKELDTDERTNEFYKF